MATSNPNKHDNSQRDWPKHEAGDPLDDIFSSFFQVEDAISFSSLSSLPPISFELPFTDPRLEPRPLEAMMMVNSKELFLSGKPDAASVATLASTAKRSKGPIHRVAGPLSRMVSSSPQQEQDENIKQDLKRFRPSQEDSWKVNFQKLIRFRNKFGHCCVPHSYPDDPVLARWSKRQRNQYKKLMVDGDTRSTLTSHRLEKLESVGFVWCAHKAAWLEKLNELKEFKASKGHCNVPSIFHENQSLSTWVKSQRRQYKHYVSGRNSTMTMDRIRELTSLDFVFEPRLPLSSSSSASKNTESQEMNDKDYIF